MRMTFFDAAGLSNPEHEPFVVVAGVIIHADKQWKALGEYLGAMADEFAPPEHRQDFAFHATELFSGTKHYKDRERYPREWRWKVLDELVAVPKHFDLPIVWGRVPRAELLPGGSLEHSGGLDPVIHGQMIAFTVASAAVEHWMNAVADPEEMAQMVMENDDQSRKFIKIIQRLLSDPKYHSLFSEEDAKFKLTRVIYPIHFEEKTDSSALQLADVCAFALKRKTMNTPECARFYDPLEPFLVNKLRPDSQLVSSEGRSS